MAHLRLSLGSPEQRVGPGGSEALAGESERQAAAPWTVGAERSQL